MRRHLPLMPLFVAICLLLAGCASTIDIGDVTGEFRSMSYDRALQSYQAKARQIVSAQGPIVYNMDCGLIYAQIGDYRTSNDLLTQAENQIAAEYTKSIVQGIGSYLVNDNVVDYAGEDYEDIYINVFKALNYWTLGSAEEAMVELRRSAEKQGLLQARYDEQWSQVSSYVSSNNYAVDVKHHKYAFSSSALSNYLLMVMSRSMRDYNTFDVAMRQVAVAFNAQTDLYAFPFPTFMQGESYDMDPSLARLNLVVFTGMSMVKEQREEFIDMPNNTVGKLAYPVLVSRPSSISGVRLVLDGKRTLSLELIEDMDAIILDTFTPKQDLAISKTILRSLIKNTATQVYGVMARSEEQNEKEKAKDKENNQGSGSSILFSLLSIFSQVSNVVSEQADVRGAHFLPSKAWAYGISLAPGSHEVEIQFIGHSGNILDSIRRTVEVRTGETNLVHASCPL